MVLSSGPNHVSIMPTAKVLDPRRVSRVIRSDGHEHLSASGKLPSAEGLRARYLEAILAGLADVTIQTVERKFYQAQIPLLPADCRKPVPRLECEGLTIVT